MFEVLAGELGLAVPGEGETGRATRGLPGSRVFAAFGEGLIGRPKNGLAGRRGTVELEESLSQGRPTLEPRGAGTPPLEREPKGLRFPEGQFRTGNLGPKRGIVA